MKNGGGNPFSSRMHSTGREPKSGDKKKLTIETGGIPPSTGTRSGLPTPDPERKKTIETEAPLQNPELSTPLQSSSRGKRRDSEPPTPMPSIAMTEDMRKVGGALASMHQNVKELTKSALELGKQAEHLEALHQSLKLQEEVG